MRASCASTSSRCVSDGTACTAVLGSDDAASMTGSRRRSPPRISPCARPGRPTWTARWTSSRCAGRERPPRRRRAGDRPAHAHALRRGLRHVAVRRGVAVGGDRRLLPAAARSARRGRSADAVADTRAVRPAGSAPGLGARFAAFVEDVRRTRTQRTRAGCAPAATSCWRASSSAPGPTTTAALDALRRRGGDLLGTRSPHAQLDLLGDPRDPAAASDRRRRAHAGARRSRISSSAFRRALARRLLAARVRLRPMARARARGCRSARRVRRADRPASASATAEHLQPDRHRVGGAARARSTASTISLVWSDGGYPAGGAYRDYHHHTVHHHNPVEQRRRRLRP